MANKLRQNHPGYWYHRYARGLEEVPLFTSDKERAWFINRMDDLFLRQKVSIGASGTAYGIC